MKDLRARFGGRLHALRVARRLTQEQLAERAGLSYKFIGEIERGTANPTLETLNSLCEGLGIGLGQLLVDVEQGQVSQVDLYPVSGHDVQAVREALSSLDNALHRMDIPFRLRRRRRTK